jgi:hypothetical protein
MESKVIKFDKNQADMINRIILHVNYMQAQNTEKDR